MIVENAFWKLPELMMSNFDHADTYEATVVHLFGVALYMELAARSIPLAYQYVEKEKPYPKSQPNQADLMLTLVPALMNPRLALYGAREKNWIEAKGFFSKTREGPAPPTTQNAGRLVRDLLRLCLLPDEPPGAIRQNGRYFLVVADRTFDEYVAMGGKTGERGWLKRILAPGTHEIVIDLKEEPKSLRGAVGPGFESQGDVRMELVTHTSCFAPDYGGLPPQFWGCLVRMSRFKIAAGGFATEYEDRPSSSWTGDSALAAVREEVLKRGEGLREQQDEGGRGE